MKLKVGARFLRRSENSQFTENKSAKFDFLTHIFNIIKLIRNRAIVGLPKYKITLKSKDYFTVLYTEMKNEKLRNIFQ